MHRLNKQKHAQVGKPQQLNDLDFSTIKKWLRKSIYWFLYMIKRQIYSDLIKKNLREKPLFPQ